MATKLALWGARANSAGLGNQSWEFWRHVQPEATAVIDYSAVDGKTSYPDRYQGPGITHLHGAPSNAEIEGWLDLEQPDAVVTMETAYNYHLYTACRARGITTFCQYNYEFIRYDQNPHLPLPDVLMAPTHWRLDRAQALLGRSAWVRYLPVPVATDRFPKRPPKRLKRFLHVAGYQLHKDRNGTEALLRAIPLVKTQDIEFTILSQHALEGCDDPRTHVVHTNLLNYWDLYAHGDCLLLPRRYGGLCLPMQEGMAAGLVVCMPEVLPNTALLHPDTLFPVRTLDESGAYPVADVDPAILAMQIDRMAEWGVEQVAEVVEYQSARVHPWSAWTDRYREFFESHLVRRANG